MLSSKKAVGRGSATRKYDLLTILGTYALSQGKTLQRQTLRLICLITARYNWQNDHLSVGQTEIARLWSVNPRTVKREMAAFRDRGWLVEKRPAARGRVTLYGLGIARILDDTREVWEKVGPDLVERLTPEPQSAEPSKVIPFPQVSLPPEDTLWGRVAQLLSLEDAALYRSWFAALEPLEGGAGELVLKAPSAFHATYVTTHLMPRIESALRSVAPGSRCRIC
ncbi:DnaA N-terminal domain-containing protein [Pseudodonghicola flavimaris]|uniref:DnaA N-terminal domain-containing protein n=1 Tax=Pseudodonghicola flavimaris TaxID=3050036 RepID=A0ABT7F880_9RHOB|nr:DnaA N-terminal domain-containing protein [Pseudodonghicola flavimaris]MDK3020831.1 hypothetical protein [Pseudodonghicola flavimaris]